jgi:hypothetical protein
VIAPVHRSGGDGSGREQHGRKDRRGSARDDQRGDQRLCGVGRSDTY